MADPSFYTQEGSQEELVKHSLAKKSLESKIEDWEVEAEWLDFIEE